MSVTPSFVMSGSILAGTAEHRLDHIDTELEVVSNATPDMIAGVVEQAERMCFVLDALQRSHSVSLGASLNGEPLPPGS